MKQLNRVVAEQSMVKLAAVECAASCIMSYLAYKGMNYKYFLLGYWNVNYFSQVLMSGKNIRRYNLKDVYGFEMTLYSGDEASIRSWLEQGYALLFRCKASELPHFPRTYLQFEESLFDHYILLLRYEQDEAQYLIIDPIGEYAGGLSSRSLADMEWGGKCYYYVLAHPDPAFRQPSPQAIFQQAAKINFESYARSKLNQGKQAFVLFEQDLLAAPDWTADKRDGWVERNNITISSIVKTRSLIWDSLRELDLLTVAQREHLQPLFSQLIRRWTALNLQLLKFKRSPHDQARISSVQQHIHFLREQEYSFLEQLRDIGQEWDMRL